MKAADLLAPAADWRHENWAERINACASMLFLHGYIPLSQREKIGRKLEGQFASAMSAREGQDAARLEAKPASAVGTSRDAQPNP